KSRATRVAGVLSQIGRLRLDGSVLAGCPNATVQRSSRFWPSAPAHLMCGKRFDAAEVRSGKLEDEYRPPDWRGSGAGGGEIRPPAAFGRCAGGSSLPLLVRRR